MVLPEPAEEAQQAEADDEVGDPDRPDVQGARTEEAPPGVEGRAAVRGHGVDHRERVRREEHEQREGAGVEAIREPRRQDGRHREPAEGRRLERDGHDVGRGADADGEEQGPEEEGRPGQAEEEA